ncbi:hypothetical protein F4778DRAFT_786933 [Xylariomycetidae sp. FL2044]|nr:hypothetical protein F4778DRAFT_786933 [Xylariomycetidae sp. FL2044]
MRVERLEERIGHHIARLKTPSSSGSRSNIAKPAPGKQPHRSKRASSAPTLGTKRPAGLEDAGKARAAKKRVGSISKAAEGKTPAGHANPDGVKPDGHHLKVLRLRNSNTGVPGDIETPLIVDSSPVQRAVDTQTQTVRGDFQGDDSGDGESVDRSEVSGRGRKHVDASRADLERQLAKIKARLAAAETSAASAKAELKVNGKVVDDMPELFQDTNWF